MASSILVGAKKQALDAIFISGNTYKVALFNSSYDASTATYGTTNEVTGTGWSAGGVTLSGVSTATSGTTAYADAADVEETGVTVSGVRYLVVYDDIDNDEVRGVIDLGEDKAVSGGTLKITWPAADASNAVFRIIDPA